MVVSWWMTWAAAAAAPDCTANPVHVDGVGYATLHAALAAASAEDRVEICPGTYAGPFTADVPVELVGLDGASTTVLDGSGVDTTLTLPGGSSLQGLTITGGASPADGGGLLLSEAGTLVIVDSVIEDNDAVLQGGGLWLPDGSVLELHGSWIRDNAARDGGGIAAGEGSVTLDLGDGVISGNLARGEQTSELSARAGLGGGVYMWGGEVHDGLIVSNEALLVLPRFSVGSGGGLSAIGEVHIEGTHLIDNVADTGGGMRLLRSSTLVDVLVEGNRGRNAGGITITTLDSLVVIDTTNTVIRGNEARFNGAGVYVSASGDTLVWRNGLIADNVAGADDNSSGSGGGMLITSGTVEIYDAEFRNNLADGGYGGGLGTNFGNPFREQSLLLDGCAFIGNRAGGRDGGGADIGFGGTIVRSRFEGNSAGRNGGGLSMYGYGSLERYADGPLTYVVDDTVIRGNESGDQAGGVLLDANAIVSGARVTIDDNRATSGGGIAVVEGSLTLDDSDLGVCPDNLPDDVYIDVLAASERNYGAVSTLICDETGCAPPPPALVCVDPLAPVCVHPTARVSPWALVDDGTRVSEHARVNDRAEYGENGLIGARATIGHDAEAGARTQVCERSRLRDRASIGDDVTIEADATIGTDVTLADEVIVRDSVLLRDRASVGTASEIGAGATVGHDVEIGDVVQIGAGALLRDRCTIGDGAVIGAGAEIGFDVTIEPGEVVPAGAVLR